jgi:hypothetical protein
MAVISPNPHYNPLYNFFFNIKSDGSKYVGDYFEGQKQGFGHFSWPDGSEFKGEFLGNVMEGKGTYAWADGRQYIGDWKNSKMDGMGVFTWLDGKKYKYILYIFIDFYIYFC